METLQRLQTRGEAYPQSGPSGRPRCDGVPKTGNGDKRSEATGIDKTRRSDSTRQLRMQTASSVEHPTQTVCRIGKEGRRRKRLCKCDASVNHWVQRAILGRSLAGKGNSNLGNGCRDQRRRRLLNLGQVRWVCVYAVFGSFRIVIRTRLQTGSASGPDSAKGGWSRRLECRLDIVVVSSLQLYL